MRHVLTALLAVHGALHLLGFVRWTGLAQVPQLAGPTLVAVGRGFGVAWLVAALALLAAATLRLARPHDAAWWWLAAAGVVLSQALIIVAWSDARFGTIANVLLVLPIVLGAGSWAFARGTQAQVDALLAAAQPPRARSLDELPPPVRDWLVKSGSTAQAPVRSVRLAQRGQLRTAPDGPWLEVTAQQVVSTQPPAFLWAVDTTMAKVLPVVGRDRYAGGQGRMYITVGGLLAVADASDASVAEGALIRFLAEAVWYPSLLLDPGLTWRQDSPLSATATLVDAGVRASVTFHVDDAGQVVRVTALRPYAVGGAPATPTPWSVVIGAWDIHEGVRVPTRGEVIWHLPAGDFVFYRWQVTSSDSRR